MAPRSADSAGLSHSRLAPPGTGYVGRFAPSPTGPLHAGSLVAALASWLDARAHGGRWLVRMEDVDTPRCVPGADRLILEQLAACGLTPDEPPLWQSTRSAHYQAALDSLLARHRAYPCGCSRSEVAAHWQSPGHPGVPRSDWPYPGTCRDGPRGKSAHSLRLRLEDGSEVGWMDRRLGLQHQAVTQQVGDFVLRRADGLWAYQLAVVVDDAEQGITDVVRGEDLADNTPRQIALQHALGLPTPRYLHAPLVFDAQGRKLSKSSGAPPLVPGPHAVAQALRAVALHQAADTAAGGGDVRLDELLRAGVAAWRQRWLSSTA